MTWTSTRLRRRRGRSPTGPVPVVAVVGRPNVGKSTLVNRIIGRRQAVVEDVPGVTRDRVAYDAQWNGRRFTVVDTGGWEPDAKDRAAAIAAQAEIAVADRRRGPVRGRRHGRRHRRGRGRGEDAAAQRTSRCILVANKADNQHIEIEADVAVVARAGRAVPGLGAARPRLRRPARRRSSRRCPAAPPIARGRPARPAPGRAGRPAERRQVQPAQPAGPARSARSSTRSPGTTVDPVDSLVEIGGETWQFVDTAGPAQAGRPGQRHGVLRQPAHRRRDRGGRGRGRAAGRQRADQRAGPAGADAW